MNAASPQGRGQRRRIAREARDAFAPMAVFAVRDRVSGRVRKSAIHRGSR